MRRLNCTLITLQPEYKLHIVELTVLRKITASLAGHIILLLHLLLVLTPTAATTNPSLSLLHLRRLLPSALLPLKPPIHQIS